MPSECFGPLGSLCAFLGALGLILTLFGLIGTFALGDAAWERIGTVPPFACIPLAGVILLVIVILLAVINQGRLSPGCPAHAAWTGSIALFDHP